MIDILQMIFFQWQSAECIFPSDSKSWAYRFCVHRESEFCTLHVTAGGEKYDDNGTRITLTLSGDLVCKHSNV